MHSRKVPHAKGGKRRKRRVDDVFAVPRTRILSAGLSLWSPLSVQPTRYRPRGLRARATVNALQAAGAGMQTTGESVLFIGTLFSNLYTAVDTPAKGRVGVCVVFVFAWWKYVLGHSRVSQPPNSGYASSGTLAFSLRRMPPRLAADDALTHTGSSTALLPAPLPSHGPIPFTFPPRPDLHYVHPR